MAKKEQAYAKELKKEAMKQLKILAKKHNIKTIGGFIYKKQDNLFFWMIVSLAYYENRYTIYGEIQAKPYCLDELFWDIFGMEDNKNQPDSLRANGAYVAPSVKFDSIDIKIESKEELEDICNELLNEFNKKVQCFLNIVTDKESYYNYINEEVDYENRELLYILLEIQQCNYNRALEMIERELYAKKTGGFIAGDKNIYEFAKEYCIKQLK